MTLGSGPSVLYFAAALLGAETAHALGLAGLWGAVRREPGLVNRSRCATRYQGIGAARPH